MKNNLNNKFKNKSLNNERYYLFKRNFSKAFFKKIFIIFMSAWILYSIFQGSIGYFFIKFIENFFNVSNDSAFSIYSRLIRSNKYAIIILFAIISSLLLFRSLLNEITKYFNEISDALNIITKNENKNINLSNEMYFIENELKNAQLIISKREEEARKSEQRKNDLVLYLAHDIRTPLTSIIGYLSLLSEAEDMPDEQRKKYINITLEKSQRLEFLVNEFFEITRFNINKIVLKKESLNLAMMLRQLTDEFYPLLNKNHMKVSLSLNENLIIKADPYKLGRVFNNILKNAILYSYENSVIDISIQAIDIFALITFKSYGPTIPKENLDNIFDMFYRLDTSRSSSGGTGIGLSIAKEIIIAHKGKIDAFSEDNVTSFNIYIPLD